MAFPQFPKKYEEEVIITPKQHLLTEKEEFENFQRPKSVIFCFETYVMDYYKALENTEHQSFWTGEIIYFTDAETAIVGNFGIGGPAASHIFEILIAAGVEEFIVVGHAGGLQKSNPIGTIILSDKSVRDEGVSHHYLKPGKYAYPSAVLKEKIKKNLEENGISHKVGGSWTIDSMYRETKGEINHYAKEGIATVEMELASLFAVATFRNVHIASLLVISDYLAFEDWEEHLNSEVTSTSIFKAMEVAKAVLTS
jgi:uridine phosphorylase